MCFWNLDVGWKWNLDSIGMELGLRQYERTMVAVGFGIGVWIGIGKGVGSGVFIRIAIKFGLRFQLRLFGARIGFKLRFGLRLDWIGYLCIGLAVSAPRNR